MRMKLQNKTLLRRNDLPLINLWPDEYDWNAHRNPSSRCKLPEPVDFFPIGTHKSTWDGGDVVYFEGLILTKDGYLGKFRRFGCFSVIATEVDLMLFFKSL